MFSKTDIEGSKLLLEDDQKIHPFLFKGEYTDQYKEILPLNIITHDHRYCGDTDEVRNSDESKSFNKIFPSFYNDRDIDVQEGDSGSGKTYRAMAKMICYARRYPNNDIIIIRPREDKVIDRFIKKLIKMPGGKYYNKPLSIVKNEIEKKTDVFYKDKSATAWAAYENCLIVLDDCDMEDFTNKQKRNFNLFLTNICNKMRKFGVSAIINIHHVDNMTQSGRSLNREYTTWDLFPCNMAENHLERRLDKLRIKSKEKRDIVKMEDLKNKETYEDLLDEYGRVMKSKIPKCVSIVRKIHGNNNHDLFIVRKDIIIKN